MEEGGREGGRTEVYRVFFLTESLQFVLRGGPEYGRVRRMIPVLVSRY